MIRTLGRESSRVSSRVVSYINGAKQRASRAYRAVAARFTVEDAERIIDWSLTLVLFGAAFVFGAFVLGVAWRTFFVIGGGW